MIEDRREKVDDMNKVMEIIFSYLHPEAYLEQQDNKLPEEEGFADIEYKGESDEAMEEFQKMGLLDLDISQFPT